MQKQLLALFVSFLIAGCTTLSNEQRKSHSIFDDDWTAKPDFGELRKTIGWSDSYLSVCNTGRPSQKMVQEMESENWSRATEIGLEWLSQCPIDMLIHYYVAISLENLESLVEAENHYRWSSGLMDSLVASGDGKTPETAYVTISISEEYDALYFFGLKRKSQALVSGEVLCDLLTATNKDGKEFEIYFHPAAHFARLNKIFSR